MSIYHVRTIFPRQLSRWESSPAVGPIRSSQITRKGIYTMEARTKALQKNRQWFLVSGILTVILGTLAISVPFWSSLVFYTGIGGIFYVIGLIQTIHASWSRKWGGFYFESLGGVLYLLVGMVLLGNPGAGVRMVTLFVALLLITQGMVQISLSSELLPMLSKGWMFTSGVAAVLLGLLTWMQWPDSALWLTGLFVGIHLLLRGWSLVIMAVSIPVDRRLDSVVPTPEMS